jgi:hypothetical protein
MSKALRLVTAFLYFSLAFSLGLSQAQSKSGAKVITVYQDPG